MAMHVRKGDMVVVIAGDDKGKTGEVLSIMPDKGMVLIQGINQVYKHMRPSKKNPQGGRVRKEKPVSISNVLPVDPETSRPTRVRFEISADGTKQRVAVRSGKPLGVVKKVK